MSSFMRHPRPVLASVAVGCVMATGGVLLSTGTASAATPPSLTSVQQKAAAAITARVNALNSAVTKVKADTDLGTDQAALLQRLQGDITGLQQLGQKIAADTTVTAAVADAKTIGTNFRIFALVLPSTRIVAAADQITNVAVPKLTARATKLASRETPANQATVGPVLSDLNAKLAAAKTAVSGLPASVGGFTAAGWNANHSILDPDKAALKTARGDLAAAKADAKKAAGELKSSRRS